MIEALHPAFVGVRFERVGRVATLAATLIAVARKPVGRSRVHT
jgi:hypothetical protein